MKERKPIVLPDLRTGKPIQVAGKVYAIESIRVSGYDIYLKLSGQPDMIRFDPIHMTAEQRTL